MKSLYTIERQQGDIKMKRINKLTAVISHDKRLISLLSGMVLSGIGLLSVAVTAFVWYL